MRKRDDFDKLSDWLEQNVCFEPEKPKTTLWATCNRCKDQVEMEVHAEDYQAWEDGELIQNAMPYLSADEREVLISGTCGPCFEQMFGEGEDDEYGDDDLTSEKDVI